MKVPLAKPFLDEEMKNAALSALQNERFVLGESVFKFEEEFARYCGVKHAVSISSGTDALQITLLALGIGKKNQVITTPYSFIATANVILHVNALPIFSDVSLKTFNIDPDLIIGKINKKVKAILPVHLYGFPADMEPILKLSKENDLFVVEDACQAHGAEYFSQRAGSLGDVGCFSFYPSKNMTVCGDGGMVVTDNKEIAQKVAKLRDCGRISHYKHDMIGFTSRLNTVNAAIGRVQLKQLDGWNKKRLEHAKYYDRLLEDLKEVILPPRESSNIKPVFHLYVIRARFRDQLKDFLEKNGIQCGIHYPIPIHLQPIYRQLFSYKRGDFPNSELLSNTVLSLPMFPNLEKEEIEYICEKISEFYKPKG